MTTTRLYRSREEVETWRRHDPVARVRQYLIENRLLTEADEERIDNEVIAGPGPARWRPPRPPPIPTRPTARCTPGSIEPGPPVTEPDRRPRGETVNLITAINLALQR